MSKWIAEFDLEDGDTMPEHMDLEYKGVKLDFHCRPMTVTAMDKLNNAIANTAYILDCLRNLRSIYETGDCNNCGIKAVCKVKPKLGQMVRYNCPFYEKDGSDGSTD